MKKKLFFVSFFAVFFALYQGLNAQVFDDEDSSGSYSENDGKNEKTTVSPTKQSNNGSEFNLPKSVDSQPAKAVENKDKNKNSTAKEAASTNKSSETKSTTASAQPEVKKPLTQDVKQYRIVDGKRVEDVEREAIYFYYKDFKMVRNVGQTACDVRFVLVTKLAEKLSSIALKIVWPDLGTRISFDGVEPGIEYYADYRFYGQGCYSLDKLPNITINRCRLKGRTQRECASLFQLMKWVDD